ncbi:hypothetical protein [Salinimicrobium sp. HB62]|uniref:hypothetical protein n=1 Tax=Salinimicrobium sp. HB62 TaxID=3077781 RepID=UPI002D781888|nr:hypothetical protein [Salinimicrobium sp. HB62]
MRSYFVLLSLLLFLSSCSSDSPEQEKPEPKPTEKYFTNHKAFSSQAEVDDFAEEGFTVITGNLILSVGAYNSKDPITDVSGLSSLTSVRGDVYIIGTDLVDLDGLENIDLEDDSFISIVNNPFLKNVKGLGGITGEVRQLEIRMSPNLENLNGLEGITGVSYQLELRDLPKLNNLSPLSNIQQPVEYMYLTGTGIISTNGIGNIPQVKDLWIVHNDKLTSLNLPGLKKVDFFQIQHNSILENISGLTNLEDVQQLGISYNESLTSLNGLEGLKAHGDLFVRAINNNSLENYCSLQNLIAAGWTGFNALQNLYNPTIEQVAGEECKL